MVTIVPPVMGPLTGRMLVTVGAGLDTAFTLIVPNMLLCPEPQSGMSQTNANVPGVVAVNWKFTVFPRPQSRPFSM